MSDADNTVEQTTTETPETPDAPALALWRHVSVLREWRGDNHLAELIGHGLTGLEAGVFHEADLPDPAVRRRVMGRRFFRITRGWSEEQWGEAVARLTPAEIEVKRSRFLCMLERVDADRTARVRPAARRRARVSPGWERRLVAV